MFVSSDRGGDDGGVIWRSPIVLNKQESSGIVLEQPLDVALTLAMADLKAGFIDLETGGVRYGNIRGSDVFERYKNLAGELKKFDLTSLKSRSNASLSGSTSTIPW